MSAAASEHQESQNPEPLRCDKCGCYGARAIGASKVCDDCFGAGCSCGPEFGSEEAGNED